MEKDSDDKTMGKTLNSIFSTLICMMLIYWLIDWVKNEYKKTIKFYKNLISSKK